MSNKIVDRLSMPPEALDALVRAVPTEVVRGIVSDHVKTAAPAGPSKTLVEKLVKKFGPKSA